MHSLFSRRLRGNRFTERELLENWSLGAQPRGTIGPDSCKSATRGGKIIPVLDSQDPTNLDSFPARVLAQTTWSRAKTPLWTLDKTYDSVKERKKERKKLHIHPTIHFYPCNLILFKQWKGNGDFFKRNIPLLQISSNFYRIFLELPLFHFSKTIFAKQFLYASQKIWYFDTRS